MFCSNASLICRKAPVYVILSWELLVATMQLSPSLRLLSQSKCQECTWNEWERANSSPMMSLMSATCRTAHPALPLLSVYKTKPSSEAHFLHWKGDKSVWGSSPQQGDHALFEIRQKNIFCTAQEIDKLQYRTFDFWKMRCPLWNKVFATAK